MSYEMNSDFEQILKMGDAYQEMAQRCRCLGRLAQGEPLITVAQREGLEQKLLKKWERSFKKEGIASLLPRFPDVAGASVVGRREWIDFPQLQLSGISAKIDTGAYTSALHCRQIEKRISDDKDVVYFEVTLLSPAAPEVKAITCPIFREGFVKNSFGSSEWRYFIKTPIILFRQEFDIELSLTDRSQMKQPLLLGRKALHRRFLVDASHVHLSHRHS